MKKQAVHSIAHSFLLLCGMGVVWYLESIDSWLVAPAFILVALLGFLFNAIPGNIKSLNEKWDAQRKDKE